MKSHLRSKSDAEKQVIAAMKTGSAPQKIEEPPAEKTAQDYITMLKKKLQKSTTFWVEIAAGITEADKAFKGNKTEMLKVCDGLNISYSTARRWIRINNCAWLRNYTKELALLDKWGTLHQLTLLKPAEKEKFIKERLKPGQISVITRQIVQSYRESKPKRPTEFRLSGRGARSGSLTLEEIEQITGLWEKIKAIAGDKMTFAESDDWPSSADIPVASANQPSEPIEALTGGMDG